MKFPAFTRRHAVIGLHVSVGCLLCFYWLLASSSGNWPAAVDPRIHPGRVLLGLYAVMGMGMAFAAQAATLAPRLFKRISAEGAVEMHFIATQCIALSCLLFLVTAAHDF